VGGIAATVISAGKVSGLLGLDQINIRVPTGVPSGGTVAVRVAYRGRASNEVTLAVQ
jgi:uncharacterized protein (TIGR03437 family)